MIAFSGGKRAHFLVEDWKGSLRSYYFVYFCENCNVKIPISAITYITGSGELDQSRQPIQCESNRSDPIWISVQPSDTIIEYKQATTSVRVYALSRLAMRGNESRAGRPERWWSVLGVVVGCFSLVFFLCAPFVVIAISYEASPTARCPHLKTSCPASRGLLIKLLARCKNTYSLAERREGKEKKNKCGDC